MNRSTRPESWFASWMLGSDAVNTRRQQAAELQSAIESHQYDRDTIKDLISILNHEILCTHINNIDPLPESARALFPCALSPHWTDGLLLSSSGAMIQCLNDETRTYRILQCQLQLTAMSLMHVQGVHTLHAERHDTLHRNLEARFKDLQWEPGNSGELTIPKFHKVQCSYLLSATNEYAAQFKKAEPMAITVATRITHLLTAGLAGAGPAMGGSVDLNKILAELDKGLKNVAYKQNEFYRGLFTLQEFSILASALSQYSIILSTDLTKAVEASESQEIAHRCREVAFGRVQTLIEEKGDFETKISPPSAFWASFKALVNHGPPSFDTFYYVMGLLDMAVELGAEAQQSDRYSLKDLNERMVQIAVRSNEPAFRWKAIQYLSLTEPSPESLAQRLLLESGINRSAPTLKEEVLEIYKDVWHSRDVVIQPIYRISSNSVASNQPRTGAIEPDSCREKSFIVPEINNDVHSYAFPKKQYQACGLSPNCRAAYLMEKAQISILSIENLRAGLDVSIRKVKVEKNKVFERAALNDSYLATFTKTELMVASYSVNGSSGELMVHKNFPTRSDGSQWIPRCLAIRSVGNRTWVAIAGETYDEGISFGSILLYEVRAGPSKLELVKCDVSFSTPGLDNPLREALIKFIHFDPDGGRLIAITRANRVLIWYMSNNMRPLYTPFSRTCPYRPEVAAQGLTSAHVFHSRARIPYVICTTWPSRERARYKGEWCFITPIAQSNAAVNEEVVHNIVQLREDEAIIASAASPTADVIAMTDKTGKIFVFPLKASTWGGLRTDGKITLNRHLASQNHTSSSALRFVYDNGCLHLFAIDCKGKVLHKEFAGFQPLPVRPYETDPSSSSDSSREGSTYHSTHESTSLARELSRRGTLDVANHILPILSETVEAD